MSNSSNVSIFEIPLILELICDNYSSKQDLQSCLQVCRLWYTIFRPHLIRYVRFADLKASQTQHVVEHAHRIRNLEIDISDAECFLEPTQCINLDTLSCTDFGYMPWPTSSDHYDIRTELLHPVDPNMNALKLIDQNPQMRTLRVEHNRRHYGLSHFSPDVLSALSVHQSLSLIKFNLCYRNKDDPRILLSMLQHLPRSLCDLEIYADWTINGSLPSLREFVFNGLRRSYDGDEALYEIFKFVGRSGLSLETLKIDIRDGGAITAGMLSHLNVCKNLKTLWFTQDDNERDYFSRPNEELFVPLAIFVNYVTSGNLSRVQSLRLRISELSQEVCSDDICWTWEEQGQGINTEALEHLKGFVQGVHALFGSLKSLTDLKEMELSWSLCDTIRDAPQELVFNIVDKVAGMDNSDSIEQTIEISITNEDLAWMGLRWSILSVVKRQAAERKEREKERILSDERWMKWSKDLRRFGRCWVDWEALDHCCDFALVNWYRDIELCVSGPWHKDRKKYFKTGKSHHRRSLKHDRRR
ncbi:hypothetical protein BGX28_009217 [Mortierella sp. GBA30]|nr:hypothetical protein BGX28_009217 [Mortierella sp. GBA30]